MEKKKKRKARRKECKEEWMLVNRKFVSQRPIPLSIFHVFDSIVVVVIVIVVAICLFQLIAI